MERPIADDRPNRRSSDRISILHIVLSVATGGMEHFIYNLAVGADRERFDMSVLCLVEKGMLEERFKRAGVATELLDGMVPGFSMVYPRRLIRYIENSGCDIVHTHSGCWGKTAAACAYLKNVKLIYTDHGRAYPELRGRVLLDRVSALVTDRIVAVGDPLHDYLLQSVGIPQKKLVTIRNGIDTERFKPAGCRDDVRREFGFESDQVVTGIVARLAPVKNHQYLLHAFKKVAERCPQARLMIIGDGDRRSELEHLCRELAIDGQVRFVGEQENVPRVLNACDLATLSSVSEGISLTILEAMATGLPVVATDVGGNGTIISEGSNGFLVPLRNAETYAQRLCELVQDAESRRRMGEQARQDVMNHWSQPHMVSAYEQLYEDVSVE